MLVRRARHLQQAAAHRRDLLLCGALQRLAHGQIGVRNLCDTDRYDILPEVGCRLGLDTADNRTLWRDQALVEVNRAVLHSFDSAGVTIADHHTESECFLKHLARE